MPYKGLLSDKGYDTRDSRVCEKCAVGNFLFLGSREPAQETLEISLVRNTVLCPGCVSLLSEVPPRWLEILKESRCRRVLEEAETPNTSPK